MPDAITRLLEALLHLVLPATGRHRLTARHGYAPPHPPVDGPTPHRFGARPLRGEDNALVRPYLVAHERRERQRRRRARRGPLLLAPQGIDLRPHHSYPDPIHDMGMTA
ncbi:MULTISPECIES: hypothetical protein [unclassified Streptomyces]|uniref:hypothetical protein n=1 Tax=unclassified Streptomyces TaxID=2593676 RepID=UPI000AEE07C5|nr:MULTISPECIES: hypothetical protein [unclassified Streptomyces]